MRSAGEVAVGDGAGIVIVDNLAAAWIEGQEWIVDSVQDMVIRAAGPDRKRDLLNVRNIVRITDVDLVVVHLALIDGHLTYPDYGSGTEADHDQKARGASDMKRERCHRHGRARSGFVLLLAGVTIGCASERTTTSAKVNDLRATGRVEITGTPPLTLLGTAPDGTARLSIPVHATRLPHGDIIVADRGAKALVLFDSAGTWLRQAGREGGGHGEFRSLHRVRHCGGDTLLTFDRSQQRLAVFDATLTPVRTIAVPSAFEMECSPAGIVTGTELMGVGFPSADGPVMTARVRILNAAGDSIGGIASVEMGQNRPMAAIATFALSADRIYVGTGSRAEVNVHDLTGRPLAPILLDWQPRASTPGHHDAAIQKLLGQFRADDRESREFYLKTIEGIPRPDWLPFYTRILTDPSGNVWLVASTSGDGYTELVALRSDGREIGTLTLPVDMEVWEVGDDHLLGGVDTESGERTVVSYRFRIRPEG